MPYKVLVDGATVLRQIGDWKTSGGETVYDNVATVYPKGTVLADEDVSPVLQKLLDDGDEHVSSLLEKTSEEPTTEGDELGLEDVVTGPDTGSPGRIMVDKAADNPDLFHEDDDPGSAMTASDHAEIQAEQIKAEAQAADEAAAADAESGSKTPAKKAAAKE